MINRSIVIAVKIKQHVARSASSGYARCSFWGHLVNQKGILVDMANIDLVDAVRGSEVSIQDLEFPWFSRVLTEVCRDFF